MPYLKPESLKDTFDVSFRVRDGGNPYEFGICASIRGQFMLVEGLSMGEIPEYDGYCLVCCIKSIPDEVQMAITDEGEVVG